jgi:hypothetical protein
MRGRITRQAAVAALRTIFVDPDKDILTLDEIFHVVGRDPQQPKGNKIWLENRLTSLRYHGLAAPIYTKSHPRKLAKVQLTPIGKTAIASEAGLEPVRAITLESIAWDIKEFERQNPSIVVELTATVRQGN